MPYILNDKVIVTYLDNTAKQRKEEATVVGRTMEQFPKYDVLINHNNYVLTNIKEKWLNLL
tara:strand:- start:166 stop:348 length:183 start_codon:yes stop_codon:yes gene_type:complete